jgi:carboxyl-terminal processing protease
LLVPIVLAVGCSGSGTAGKPLSPSTYLDHALSVIHSNAVYVPSGGWTPSLREARKMAVGAKTPAETYAAIIYTLGQLQRAGDMHAGFTNPENAKLEAQAEKSSGDTLTAAPVVSPLSRRIGLVNLPAIGSPPDSRNAHHYARTALRSIGALQAKAHPCGWIIDLRDDSGGDMYPMLLAVGPILGNGRAIGFVAKDGKPVFVSYRNGTLGGVGVVSRSPVSVAGIKPVPPVAVLTGLTTVSSGEAVAIAFRGRRDARSFGEPTGGATNSPQSYRLRDGASISVSADWDADRDGNVYRRAISPDVPVRGGDALEAAKHWLLSTDACSR